MKSKIKQTCVVCAMRHSVVCTVVAQHTATVEKNHKKYCILYNIIFIFTFQKIKNNFFF